jgi:hypothetical protein
VDPLIEALGKGALLLAGVIVVLGLLMVVLWQLRVIVRVTRKLQQL